MQFWREVILWLFGILGFSIVFIALVRRLLGYVHRTYTQPPVRRRLRVSVTDVWPDQRDVDAALADGVDICQGCKTFDPERCSAGHCQAGCSQQCAAGHCQECHECESDAHCLACVGQCPRCESCNECARLQGRCECRW